MGAAAGKAGDLANEPTDRDEQRTASMSLQAPVASELRIGRARVGDPVAQVHE